MIWQAMQRHAIDNTLKASAFAVGLGDETMPAQLDRKYEKYLGGPTLPPETRLHVSIDKRGVITMNAACYKLIGKP